MKRALSLIALAAVACTNRAATYSGDTSSGADTARAASSGAAISPSQLSPEQVRLVQRSLIDRGFAVDPTGNFDDRTQTALGDFQRARGLPATAALDRPTLDALGLDPREVTPPGGRAAAPASGPATEEGTGAGTGQTPGVSPYDPANSGQPDSSHPSRDGDDTDK
ncbi:peptidoglycan-binding domain-containing protein [Anaeromyxobacter diazotrophicus]|uniref:Peptidoglycan binding-like domain-containing protein n=1 Tax=Anaeromyxobacter diazotrophicus TaxID=2590199 RepID=A0A7I9VHN3_9BACT|nr:peptidoglycan-binding domain-containing protein [Anaeromyxobacter diazotrophicus]GEJ55913.1 hypothetical protein AMYX_06540 [Anaeromyxobacter diazotrophicus]